MSDLSTVISIVPRLPKAIDGVGDYALNLARQLRKDFNIQTQFIVGNPEWKGELELEGFPINQVVDSSSDQLTSFLEGDRTSPVLLHYVGYGYANRGCPVWLIKGLQRWKNLYPDRILVTMFHELYASGTPPWTSSFWLSPLQKKLVTRLAKLSDRCITSNQDYAESLYRLNLNPKKAIVTLPIFSTIGEPNYLPSPLERTKRLVVFGHKNSRKQVYQQCLVELEQISQSLNIEEIYDIGASTGLTLSDIISIPILEKGIIEASEIREIFKDSLVGFLNFPPPKYLAKSSVFATYCAHGLIPCMVHASATPIDGLEMNKHYFSTIYKSNKLSLEAGYEIANHAHAWYETHNLSAQAKIFTKYLNH
ncbi:hypothetical protein [Pseudanabaena sp. BC1403]|uniref:hypothetical protein n=1 Tax=Pseudanabaena sp. BC1403 TaxID=2043171 RepID=UPI000CD80864|nr:hypothetical protein [Pseudanabaena sp. BC1403]